MSQKKEIHWVDVPMQAARQVLRREIDEFIGLAGNEEVVLSTDFKTAWKAILPTAKSKLDLLAVHPESHIVKFLTEPREQQSPNDDVLSCYLYSLVNIINRAIEMRDEPYIPVIPGVTKGATKGGLEEPSHIKLHVPQSLLDTQPHLYNIIRNMNALRERELPQLEVKESAEIPEDKEGTKPTEADNNNHHGQSSSQGDNSDPDDSQDDASHHSDDEEKKTPEENRKEKEGEEGKKSDDNGSEESDNDEDSDESSLHESDKEDEENEENETDEENGSDSVVDNEAGVLHFTTQFAKAEKEKENILKYDKRKLTPVEEEPQYREQDLVEDDDTSIDPTNADLKCLLEHSHRPVENMPEDVSSPLSTAISIRDTSLDVMRQCEDIEIEEAQLYASQEVASSSKQILSLPPYHQGHSINEELDRLSKSKMEKKTASSSQTVEEKKEKKDKKDNKITKKIRNSKEKKADKQTEDNKRRVILPPVHERLNVKTKEDTNIKGVTYEPMPEVVQELAKLKDEMKTLVAAQNTMANCTISVTERVVSEQQVMTTTYSELMSSHAALTEQIGEWMKTIKQQQATMEAQSLEISQLTTAVTHMTKMFEEVKKDNKELKNQIRDLTRAVINGEQTEEKSQKKKKTSRSTEHEAGIQKTVQSISKPVGSKTVTFSDSQPTLLGSIPAEKPPVSSTKKSSTSAPSKQPSSGVSLLADLTSKMVDISKKLEPVNIKSLASKNQPDDSSSEVKESDRDKTVHLTAPNNEKPSGPPRKVPSELHMRNHRNSREGIKAYLERKFSSSTEVMRKLRLLDNYHKQQQADKYAAIIRAIYD